MVFDILPSPSQNGTQMTQIRTDIRHDPIRLAVLVSGEGTTLANLTEKIATEELRAQIGLVICSNHKALGCVVALNLKGRLVLREQYDCPAGFSDVVFGLIREAEIDLVCLAGFLSLLVIPDDFVGRVLNIHPALLPAFGGQGMYGLVVHEAVLAAGCKVTGCTVHFADQAYDTGPILVQRTCPVRDDDTVLALASRVFTEECLAYPEAIRLIAAKRVRIDGQRTTIRTG